MIRRLGMTETHADPGDMSREHDLPLLDNGTAAAKSTRQIHYRGGRNKLVVTIPLLMALVAAGGTAGLYFQPPGLRFIFEVTGLAPGGGSANPIAIPASNGDSGGNGKPRIERHKVTALGRLMPANDVITIAPPYGAGDARIESLDVEEGDFVVRGQVIATLDNRQQLRSAVENARTRVAVRAAELAQTRAAIQASLLEAEANYQRALATKRLAQSELQRGQELRASSQISQANLERLQATADEMRGELDRAHASLSRYAGFNEGTQPDIVLAQRNLESAAADLKRAQIDLSMAEVVAVVDGQVLSINTRIGERPGTRGIATLGNTERMEAELEVYQGDVQQVAIGQDVSISAPALGDVALAGRVARVGLEVKRQQLVENDPAANTDARVVLVRVALDPASSPRAAAFTGLQVEGRIATQAQQ